MEQKPKRTPQQQKRLTYSVVITVLIALGLGYIAFQTILDRQQRAIGNIFSGIVAELNATDTPTPTTESDEDVTLVPTLGYRCMFNWAYEDVPADDVETIRTALDDAGYEDVGLVTSAYGEDEICMEGDEVVSSRFLLMDITPRIQWTVDQETPEELGGIIRDIATTLLDIPDIPRIGYIEFEFMTEADTRMWRASNQDITIALNDEIDDNALYNLGVSGD